MLVFPVLCFSSNNISFTKHCCAGNKYGVSNFKSGEKDHRSSENPPNLSSLQEKKECLKRAPTLFYAITTAFYFCSHHRSFQNRD